VSNGFTVKWTDVANNTGYFLQHSTNATLASGVTTVNITDSNASSHALTGLTPGNIYYVRVTAYSAGGNGTASDIQANQLQSIDNNVVRYMSAPGATASGNYTVADIFGSNNEAGLASGANDSSATTIKLVNSSGSTGSAIFRNNSNQWQQASSNTAGTIEIGRGRAFILENKSGSTDYFLLVGTGTNVAPPVVNIAAEAPVALVTTGRTTATPIASIVSGTPTTTPSAATHFKAASRVADADQIIVPPLAPGSPNEVYYYNPNARGGASWMKGNLKVNGETIPAGRGFFIRKGNGSTLTEWTPPAE